MKLVRFGQLPSVLAFCSLAACAWVLIAEIGSFRDAVGSWARRDLLARTQLAADSLAEAVATGDFRRIRDFGDGCRREGVRLTILSSPGGVVYDSATQVFGKHAGRPEVESAISTGVGMALRKSATTAEEMLFCARRTGEFVIRLGLPSARVYAPFQRARTGLVLAGLVGAFSIFLAYLFTNRLIARIRERERLLAEMKREERFRREFIANLTHEFKTPLTGILGAVDLLGDGTNVTPENRRTLLELLRHETIRLNSLVQEMLVLSHLEEDQLAKHFTLVPADLSEVLKAVAARLRQKADAAHVRLSVDAALPLVVPCDVQRMETAITNLVENALRYSGSPDVVLSLSSRDGKAVVAVEDHGVGIPQEHRERIFERFYRVDKDRSRELGGTGLGLAIVKHVARLHNGTATLLPVRGGGCRFELAIPMT